MPKTNITTFTVSQNLKTGMKNAGKYTALSDLHAFYTAQNALWVALSTTDGGLMRCMGSGAGADFTDLFPSGNPDTVRAWSMDELSTWFVNNYVYDNYADILQGSTYTISFTVAGLPFSGSANREVDALAIAIIALLNSVQAKQSSASIAAPVKQPAGKQTFKK